MTTETRQIPSPALSSPLTDLELIARRDYPRTASREDWLVRRPSDGRCAIVHVWHHAGQVRRGSLVAPISSAGIDYVTPGRAWRPEALAWGSWEQSAPTEQ